MAESKGSYREDWLFAASLPGRRRTLHDALELGPAASGSFKTLEETPPTLRLELALSSQVMPEAGGILIKIDICNLLE